MLKIFKAYFKLRKGWIIALYALLLLAGLASMVNDGVQWHKWEKGVSQHTNEKEYQAFRQYYKENNDIDVYKLPSSNSNLKYLNLVTPNPKFYKGERVTGDTFYQSAPADYKTFKDSLLGYYPEARRFYDPFEFHYLSDNSKGLVDVKINLIALMSQNMLLLFIGAYALALLLDQSKNITAFIGARTGGITKLNAVQFIYWTAIPLALASVLSLVTHLTRQFFIPSQYVTIPWAAVLKMSSNRLSFALIAAIGVSLINALVGKPVYKILTGVLVVPAFGMAIMNVRYLVIYRPISDIVVKIPLYVYLLVFACLAIPIVMMLQKRHSLEQDSFYVKLEPLRLPIYIGILILAVLDFVLPFFVNDMLRSPLDMLLNLVMLVGVTVVFAKLVLDKDVRNLIRQ